MALVVGTLTPQIQAAMALGVVPPPANATSDVIAAALAVAYDAYARAGQSCAGVPPSVVNLAALQDGMKAALSGQNTAEQAGEKWAQAHYDYWLGAIFGATGTVTAILGQDALASGLESVFSNTANLLPAASQQIAAELDTFTKTVLVADTALPVPPGCGPAPIS